MLAPLIESVPPKGYGGTELVVSLLTEGLVERGHDVTLFASGDSSTSAKLIPCVPKALRTDDGTPPRRWPAYDLCLLIELERRLKDFDIVHNHMGYQALPYLKKLHLPSITTNHNLVKQYCERIYRHCAELAYVSISNAYRRLNMPDYLNYIATIYNGIDTGSYKFNPHRKGNYLAFLGRISQDKGTKEAIQIAERVGLPIRVAGKVDPADSEYFENEVKPLLKSGRAEYIGELNHDEKTSLLSGALAVIYPINFDEPFGLVMVESLACGTPVVALDRGSVKEILSDGENAIVGRSIDDLVSRFPELDRIPRTACRQSVEQRFSHTRMIRDYEQAYAAILSVKT
ncbi:MAG TPA: glycosyltransferase family 4 protein [Candidatus Obscuribacterales bacterium]